MLSGKYAIVKLMLAGWQSRPTQSINENREQKAEMR